MKKLILCALFASCVHAYSTGGNTGGDDSEAQSCDAIDICVGGICPEGMDKVGPPSRSAAYNVRSGTGPDPMQDATGECADRERRPGDGRGSGARALDSPRVTLSFHLCPHASPLPLSCFIVTVARCPHPLPSPQSTYRAKR